MNILFLTVSRITDISASGIYTDLLRCFQSHGHTISIICPLERRFGSNTIFQSKDGVDILQVKTLNIQKTHFIEKGVGTLLIDYQYIKGLKRYFASKKFDLILYATPPITLVKTIQFIKQRDNAYAYLMLKDIFPQNAVDLQMFSKTSLFYKYFRTKEKKLYEISDYIGCMSPANENYVLTNNNQIDKTKVGLCANSIDISRIKSVVIDKKEDAPVHFIYGGNLGKPQGLSFLIEILDYYRDNADIKFTIVGSGTELSYLENKFLQSNYNNATLLSQLPKEEYENLVAVADVGMVFLDARFTIPNFPSRLLSYLQNRLPVFCAVDKVTDIGDIAITNGFGFGCIHGDIKQATETIDIILKNKHDLSRMGELGYQYLIANYSVEFSYEGIISLIK